MDKWLQREIKNAASGRIRQILSDLSERRALLGMSDYHIADRSGVSQPTVYRILSGKNPQASFEKVMAIAEALGMTLTTNPLMEAGEFRACQADRKAASVVNRTRATSALEGQNFDARTLNQMRDSARQRLLAGPAKDLWSK